MLEVTARAQDQRDFKQPLNAGVAHAGCIDRLVVDYLLCYALGIAWPEYKQ